MANGPDEPTLQEALQSVAEAVHTAQPLETPAPDERSLADLPRNDLGNCRRLIARHGHDLMFVDGTGWLNWDGKRWRQPPAKRAPEAQKRAHQTVEAIEREADALQSDLDDALPQGRRLIPLNAHNRITGIAEKLHGLEELED